jgi:hypothetical protein
LPAADRAGVVDTGAGGRAVVAAAATGRAGRTTVAGRGVLVSGAGSGRGALEPVGAASGPADCWAAAGTAATSTTPTTIITHRKSALAPIWTSRTLAEADRTPG